jgi:hypothetical protein
MYFKPHNLLKSLTLIKKASFSLKMSSKRIEIFEKASNHFKKAHISENIFKMPPILKNKPRGNYRIATMASPNNRFL